MTERPPGRLEGADELRVTPPFDAEAETRVAPDEREAEDPPAAPAASAPPAEHAPGRLVIPDGVGAFVGMPNGVRRSVGIVVSRYNGDITTKLLGRKPQE